MNYDVFISYSRKDIAVADRICAAFDRAGITYFIDRQGISGGMEFPRVLANAIKESQLFLFLASENSYQSIFTIKEVTFAIIKKKKTLIPYIIDNSLLPDDLLLAFANINVRNINEHPINTVLVDDVLQLLGRGNPAREEEERKKREEAERRARVEAERKAKEEAERKAREEAARKAKEERERRAREEAVRKIREDAERREALEEAARRAREESKRKAQEEADRRAREEAARKARAAAARRAQIERAERVSQKQGDKYEQIPWYKKILYILGGSTVFGLFIAAICQWEWGWDGFLGAFFAGVGLSWPFLFKKYNTGCIVWIVDFILLCIIAFKFHL